MAHSLTAKKRIRQNAKRRARNRWRTKTMKGAIKSFLDTLAHGSVDDARTAYRAAASAIDRTAQKGVIHRNQAARRKSRLNARLKAKALGQPAAKA
jgi:small subunit ribosomal protein S20